MTCTKCLISKATHCKWIGNIAYMLCSACLIKEEDERPRTN